MFSIMVLKPLCPAARVRTGLFFLLNVVPKMLHFYTVFWNRKIKCVHF